MGLARSLPRLGADPSGSGVAAERVAAERHQDGSRSGDAGRGRPSSIPPCAVLLAFVFAATWFNSTAMAAHLPGLLQAAGASTAVAIAAGALIGPAQVAARVLEFGLLRWFHPLVSTRVAAAAHPVAAVALVSFGGHRGLCLRAPAWGGERDPHDSQGHSAAGVVRVGGIRAADRLAECARPHPASSGAPDLRCPADHMGPLGDLADGRDRGCLLRRSAGPQANMRRRKRASRHRPALRLRRRGSPAS